MLSDIRGTCPWATVPMALLTCAVFHCWHSQRSWRLTVSKSQFSLPVIEYFQSFQVGCKHLKNIIWNQIPQSLSGVHQNFTDVYDFCWGLWFLKQLRDCCLSVTLGLWMSESFAVLQPLPFLFGLHTPSPGLAARQDCFLCLQPRSQMSAGALGRGFSPCCLRVLAHQTPGSLGSLTEMLSPSREAHCCIPGQSQPNPTSQTTPTSKR